MVNDANHFCVVALMARPDVHGHHGRHLIWICRLVQELVDAVPGSGSIAGTLRREVLLLSDESDRRSPTAPSSPEGAGREQALATNRAMEMTRDDDLQLKGAGKMAEIRAKGWISTLPSSE